MEETTIKVQLFDEGLCRIELPRTQLNTKVYCNDVCLFIFAPSRSKDYNEHTCDCEPSCRCAERAAGAAGGCQFPLEEDERVRIDVYNEQGTKRIFMASYIMGENGLRSEMKYMAGRGLDVEVISSKQKAKEHALT